jgi:predicted TIM-barrel fold metal-dependent hydrolase
VGHYHGLEQALAEARISLARLSRLPNVYLKIGGIGMTNIGREWDRARSPSSDDLAATWGPYVRWCVEEFGPSRCMFESNFPVDRETCSYGALWNAYKLMVAGASASEKAALFAATARSFYSLPAPAARAVRND